MAKARLSRDNRKLVLLLIVIVAFGAGFLVARARYKPQIAKTFNMVQEREDTINQLREIVKSYEKQLTGKKK